MMRMKYLGILTVAVLMASCATKTTRTIGATDLCPLSVSE